MKLEVLKPFYDKLTGKLIQPDSSFETDDEERYKDLIKRGLAKSNKETSTVKKEEEEEKPKHVKSKKSGE